jgi:uncharacterized protein (DUF2252 family)
MPPPPPPSTITFITRLAIFTIATVILISTFHHPNTNNYDNNNNLQTTSNNVIQYPEEETIIPDNEQISQLSLKQKSTHNKKSSPAPVKTTPTIHIHHDTTYAPTIEKYYQAWKPVENVCVGWCPPRIDLSERLIKEFGDCSVKSTIDRLRSALQLENCAAATQSKENADQVALKVEKLADSNVFVFFRGAAALFNVDMMCSDPLFLDKKKTMPRVISNGDAHPENFGSQVMVNGGLVWGVNDFDQSFRTPFSWDLKRGSTGTYVACIAYGWNEAVCKASIDAFVSSYLAVATANATVMAARMTNEDRFLEGSRLTLQSPLINDVFRRARLAESDEEVLRWLRQGFSVDTDRDRFIPSAYILPLPDDVVPQFQRAVDRYLYNGVPAMVMYPYGDFWKVLAVARRIWAGTGSIGLDRFYLLLRGRKSTYGGRIILEMKQEVHSLLEVFFRYHYSAVESGKRAVDAERSAYPYANPFYGWTTMNGKAYIIREKSKHEKSVKLETLSPEQFLDYAVYTGKALAFYHFRVQCDDHICGLDDNVALDEEGWLAVRQYIEKVAGGRDQFHMFIADFALKESLRQIEAWEALRKLVNQARLKKEPIINLLNAPVAVDCSVVV